AGVRVDAQAPAVVAVGVPADGTYRAGDLLSFGVQTSEAVIVETAGGTPRLALSLGGTTRYADYVAGSGSDSLAFQYRVQAGDDDGDGIALGASLELDGGSLRDAAGNALALALAGVA
ncbi:hypothetical protein, partial [Azotobacter salinestris]|uniref:hypothetical protein n=1 Tax=Azotobacter salinestris TaxID=69964 RepID=UPI0032DE529D